MPTHKKVIKTKKVNSGNKKINNGICFVIMPFGGWFDSYYKEIYYPAIKNAGFDPRRADDLFRPSNIVQDIWTLTKKAKLIIANLTNKNANVFYELGLAYALAKPAILITETIDDVPFDLRSLRIIEYDKNKPNWGTILQDTLENAIRETLLSPNETIPTAFLETSRFDIHTPQITKQEKDLLEVKQELELIRRQITRNTSFTQPDVRLPTLDALKQIAHQLLIAGYSRPEVISQLSRQFQISESIGKEIVNRVLHASNDPAEPK